jgi:hypothetical protein
VTTSARTASSASIASHAATSSSHIRPVKAFMRASRSSTIVATPSVTE